MTAVSRMLAPGWTCPLCGVGLADHERDQAPRTIGLPSRPLTVTIECPACGIPWSLHEMAAPTMEYLAERDALNLPRSPDRPLGPPLRRPPTTEGMARGVAWALEHLAEAGVPVTEDMRRTVREATRELRRELRQSRRRWAA